MNFTLLLADPSHPTGSARAAPLQLQVLETSPGGQDVTVAFQPSRTDDLHASAKSAAQLAYRILLREGLVRSQIVVRLRPSNAPQNVVGHSAELLLALAILLQVYEESGQLFGAPGTPPSIAATGALAPDGSVLAVEHVEAKLEAACEHLGGSPAVIFVPAANGEQPVLQRLSRQYPHLQFRAIGHLDEALEHLGIVLERVYLQNPFRGLECFEYRHRAIFFGREAETREALAQLLRREANSVPGLLIEGASGSGKSSFLRAGLLPALVNPRSQPQDIIDGLRPRPVRDSVRASIWRIGPPTGTSGELQIAQSILDCWRALPEYAGKLSSSSLSLAALAEEYQTHWTSTHRFVWAIDQMEELFALGLDAQLIDAFGLFLLRLQSAGAWTIGCIRSDALPHLKQYDALRQVFGSNEGQYYLPTMIGTALEDVVTRPADVAGLTFGVGIGGKRLDQLLREDLYAARENTLPQLQFTLNELYMNRTGSELTCSAYARLGGLTGSIATTAAAVLDSEHEDSRGAIRSLFRSLVSVDELGNTSRRYAPMAEIDDPVQNRVLARLVAARLCVAALRDDQAVVSFAHEALLRTWPELIEWLREETGLLQMREMAQRETRLWQQHHESPAWLAPADKVAAFEALKTSGIALTAPVRNFLEHSRRRVRRTTRIKQAIFVVISVLAIVASGASWVASRKQQEAEYQVAETRKAQARLLVEAAARRLKDMDAAGAQGIIVEVLTNPEFAQSRTPTAISVFQEIRAADKELAILSGHRAEVRAARFSPDGTHIVTASHDRTARIWDARTGAQLAVLSGHDGELTNASYSPDGARIVTASFDKTARVWDARTGVQLAVLSGHDNIVTSAAYSSDGTHIITSSRDKSARVWDARTGAQLLMLSGHSGAVESASYSPDGRRIVTASGDKTARVWDARTGAQLLVLAGHDDEVTSAFYSPDGTRIITASRDKTARIWDARMGAQLTVLSGHSNFVRSAVYSPDAAQIVTSSYDKTVRIWDAHTGLQLAALSGHGSVVMSAAYSPDGTRIVSSSFDTTARIWDARMGAQLAVLSGHRGVVMSAAYSPDSAHIVTTSTDGTARIWDAHSAAELTVLSGHDSLVETAAYSPDGARIVTASNDKTARIWDAHTGAQLLVLTGHRSFVMSAAYSPDSAQIVTSSFDKTARIWDGRTGAQLAVLSGHDGEVNSASHSPDGTRIVTSSPDKTARIWDARTGAQLAVLSGHRDEVSSAVYSPDGTRILTSSFDKTARIWDARTGTQLTVLIGHGGELGSAAYSPDGTRVVTGAIDKIARIWDARTGEQLAALSGHDGLIGSVAYSPDGAHIVTASYDKTARVWDAHIPATLDAQIAWDAAAQIDGLSDVDRVQLGLPADGRVQNSTQGSACDKAAAAFYDPDRRAQGHLTSDILETANAACAAEIARPGHSARSDYQMGRASLAKHDVKNAEREFELADSKGYRAAAIDLAAILQDQGGGMFDPARAATLLEKAWKDNIPIAAYQLGHIYEIGLPTLAADADPARQIDLAKAWFWYQKGADAGEPSALARFAERDEDIALAENSITKRNSLLLQAFTRFAAAAKRAHDEGWPDDAWKSWRHRRATLARLLAREGMMQQVADAYGTVLNQFAPRPPTIWERLTSALR